MDFPWGLARSGLFRVAMPIVTLTDEASLARCVDHHDTVVIDFWAPWCAPCKGFLPILEEASARHADVVFCRVNTEDHSELARAFDVESIPTLVVIRDRIMIASQPGMLPEDVLEDLLGQVKGLDMDVVRREIAQTDEQKGAEL
ncbi:MAG: thioredoxin family protein [Planctomycetota bacterium]|jgi:thioredoxin 1